MPTSSWPRKKDVLQGTLSCKQSVHKRTFQQKQYGQTFAKFTFILGPLAASGMKHRYVLGFSAPMMMSSMWQGILHGSTSILQMSMKGPLVRRDAHAPSCFNFSRPMLWAMLCSDHCQHAIQ